MTIGQKDKLPKDALKDIELTEKETENNTALTLNLALSYGGRAEIVDAIKNIIRKGIDPEKITEETVKENLWTSDVDLVIRTGGEQRISNFLLWQLAYSEFYFTDMLWPDFDAAALELAITSYRERERRFGRTSEQLKGDKAPAGDRETRPQDA